ncbi:MAG: branched-chain amino acid aminotransferase [Planctomycetes bacterium]|nr:branched-chain amino acid aminotransferase [Planctomycetota bacterium]
MTEPIAYLSGQWVPISQARVSVFDLGLVQGASVTEMVRTFGHRPFRLEDHLARLQRSLNAVGFEPVPSTDEFQAIVERVLAHNGKLLPASHDLGIVLFVTAGLNRTYVGAAGAERAKAPTVCVHTFPLPFELWATKLDHGQHLITPATRHIPPDSLDPRIKYRSRLHWYLADRETRGLDPEASALLLDRDGFITETSSGNFFIVRDNELLTPTERTTLPGVSQKVVAELAVHLGLGYRAVDLRVYDVLNADEAFTSSTPYCLLPVTRLNGSPIGDGRPGPVFGRLLDAWSDLVGLNVAEQIRTVAAERTAQPGEPP